MQRTLYVIESSKGYLSDIERYTDNILDAVTFVDFDIAAQRLVSVSGLLSEPCWVAAEQVPFPRPTPIQLNP